MFGFEIDLVDLPLLYQRMYKFLEQRKERFPSGIAAFGRFDRLDKLIYIFSWIPRKSYGGKEGIDVACFP